MAERAPPAEHPTYRELLALGRGNTTPTAVRDHVARCPICRDVQDALAEEPGPDDLASPWLAERPVTLPAAALAAVLGEAAATSHATSRVIRPRRAAAAGPRRRTWRRAAASSLVAAAALLIVLTRAPAPPAVPDAGPPPTGAPSVTPSVAPNVSRPAPAAGDRPSPTRTPPPVRASVRTAGPRVTPSESRGVPAAPNAASGDVTGAPPVSATMPSASVRETRGELRLVLATERTGFDSAQRRALDSLAVRLTREPARGAVVRYTDPGFDGASPSALLAQRAQDYLLVAGVAPDRLRLARVQTLDAAGVSPGVEAIEVVVAVAPPRDG